MPSLTADAMRMTPSCILAPSCLFSCEPSDHLQKQHCDRISCNFDRLMSDLTTVLQKQHFGQIGLQLLYDRLYKLWQANARFDNCPGEESTSCLCSSKWDTETCRANTRTNWTSTSWSRTICRQIHTLTEARKHVRHQYKFAHSNLQTNAHVLSPKLLLFSFDWDWQECMEELTTLDEYSFGPKQGQMWNEFFQMWKLVEVLESHVGEDFIVCCLMRVSTSISHYSLSISHFSNCN